MAVQKTPALPAIMIGWMTGAYRAWVFMLCWGWFVVPATGLPGIGFWISWGLTMMITMMVYRYSPADLDASSGVPDKNLALITAALYSSIMTTSTLATAFVVHLLS